MVLLGRKGAGGILGERAWRTVGIVEIQVHLAVLDGLRVTVPAWWICLLVVREIPEFYEQTVVLLFRDVQLVRFALELKCDISVHAVFDYLTERIRLGGHFWFGITRIARAKAELPVDWKPFQKRKSKVAPSSIIPDADAVFARMFVQNHTDLVPRDESGLRLLVGAEDRHLRQLAVDLHLDSLRHLQAGGLSFPFDDAQKCGRVVRQNDLAHRVRTNQIPALIEPE